jgi:hypothetical protein
VAIGSATYPRTEEQLRDRFAADAYEVDASRQFDLTRSVPS